MRAVATLKSPGFVECLSGAGLDPARDLRGANLRDVNFGTADVAGWDLRGTDLSGADLSRVRNFEKALTDDDTTLEEDPSGLPDFAIFRDRLTDLGVGPEMVVIPSGRFMMGSLEDEDGRFDDEGPCHAVTIARRFALARYPVTFEEYDGFCAATGREPPGDNDWGRGTRPVIAVSWDDAAAYCAWLSAATAARYRLPSESEWEYACRAGTATVYPWGDAWDAGRANGSEGGPGEPSPVGSYPANRWGLHDMIGNVWEWVEDRWHDSHEGAPDDGSARLDPGSGEAGRVVRGGSWFINPRSCRAACRYRVEPDYRDLDTGFRPARTL